MPGYFRAVFARLLWTRRRAALSAVAVLVALAFLVQAGSLVARPRGSGGSPAPPASPQPAASASAASQSAGPTAQPPGPAQAAPAPALAAAVAAGEEFTAAWADHAPGWPARASRYATPRLAAQLARTSQAMLPATRVTGPARVTGLAPGTVDLSVPTDAGPALVTLRLTRGRWAADSVMLAWEGN